MAVAPTGAIYKSLIFDGEDSRDYGVYITGEAVFNAPAREVEMIAIPGKNGSFALDKGRFENIEVKYPAGIFADTETDFAEAISEFRNLLCSRNGYVRLQDEYHPNEYRMAIYKSGLEVEPAQLKAGEFDIVFDCKPQRYLTSGETAISVDSGDTVTNPTLFDAAPLLLTEGYGDITINDSTITVQNVPIGEVTVLGGKGKDSSGSTVSIRDKALQIDDLALAGDDVTITEYYYSETIKCGSGVTSASATASGGATVTASYSGTSVTITVYWENIVFHAFTDETQTETISYTYVQNGTTKTGTITITADYSLINGDSWVVVMAQTSTSITHVIKTKRYEVILNSTKSSLGHPMYVDLEIGEAFNNDSGTMVSVNGSLSIPAELPTLKPDTNTITYDNTFQSVDIVPRWWKV